MKKFLSILALSFFSISTIASPVLAQETNEALLKRLESLEQEVAILKRQIENNKEDAVTKAKDTPVVTASSKDGFSIKSADDAFKLKIRGLVQADARIFTDNHKDLAGTTDTFLIRRARPIFEGTVAKNFDF